jgi:annexin A3
MQVQADQLYEAGVGRTFGTDESVFVDIVCGESKPQLRLIAQSYERTRGSSLQAAIESECSGDFKRVLLARLLSNADFFARALHTAFKGLGTDDATVARILGAMDKEDIADVSAAYAATHDKTLWEALTAELSGRFKEAALAWCNSEDPTHGLEALTEVRRVGRLRWLPVSLASRAMRGADAGCCT